MSLKFSCDGVKEVLVLSLLSVVWNNDIILWLRRPAAVSKKKSAPNCKNGILLPKLFWPTVRKNCSSDQENLLKFEAEGRGFAKFLKSLEQFIQTVKGQNNFW